MDEGPVDQLVSQLQADFRKAELSDLDREILEYSAKLTEGPSTIDLEDVERLKQQGLDDRGVHDLCSIVAYFAFVNRIANGLGVELEAET